MATYHLLAFLDCAIIKIAEILNFSLMALLYNEADTEPGW